MSATLQHAFEQVSNKLSKNDQHALVEFLLGPVLHADEIHPLLGPLRHMKASEMQNLGINQEMISTFRKEEGL